MICPNKICAQEIPDDSCFCERCGVQLLRCAKCGFVSTAKFCGKCGGPMSAIEPPPVSASPPASTPAPSPAPPVTEAPKTAPPPAASAPPAPAPGATVVVSLPPEKLFLCHPDGWKLEITDSDILGRTNGPHAGRLGAFPVISSSHAQITRSGGGWCITDLKSTNKTFVNSAKLEPHVPAKIKQDDVVALANIVFTVREA